MLEGVVHAVVNVIARRIPVAHIAVTFTFHSGVKRRLFRNVRLSGSWDPEGRFIDQWAKFR